MISKATKRKVEAYWGEKCAACGDIAFIEFHHIIPVSKGGTDEFDNIILLCNCCHALVHGRAQKAPNPHKRTSIEYSMAIPILDAYFAEEIGAKETKEKLNLSPKTHLTESAVCKRYKREHGIGYFYNHVDTKNRKRKSNDNNSKRNVSE